MKKLVLGLMMALAAIVAFADPSVTINRAVTDNPWESEKGKITVDYSLSGIVARYQFKYKVAFDVTVKKETRGITNDWAKLTDGAATKSIDTAALFGKETVDKDAEISITLIKKQIPAGQLWENGPIWAEANLGESEVQDHPEYGAFYTCYKADADVKLLLGDEWRVPSKEDFDKLADASYCARTWDGTRKGWTFTGLGDYSSNSIFLPAAGYDLGRGREMAGNEGTYWSSVVENPYVAWYLSFREGVVKTDSIAAGNGFSVRAVRDNCDGIELVVATAKTKFWLGPGCESCPWAAGEGVTAYVRDQTLYLKGEGKVAEFAGGAPWVEYDDMLTGIGPLPRAITIPASVAATLPISVGSVIPEDMVLVSKESIQAAKAEIVNIANGMVYLGVSVLSNADITASSANWAPVKFTKDTQIGLSADGTKLILPIPVAAQQGFMILQSGDAKVSEGGVRVPVTGEPWYKPTVED